MMELRHLRNFQYLAEDLNYTRAAARANISQSTLSEQIMRLEDVIGVRLFDRSRRHVTLTKAGEQLFENVPRLLQQVSDLAEITRRAGSEVRPRLRIGYSAMSLNTPMSLILQQFRHEQPDTELVLLEQSSSTALRALRKQEVDCTFIPHPPEASDLNSMLVSRDPVMCCLPADDPLAARDVIEVADLDGSNLIMASYGSRFGSFISAVLASEQIDIDIVARVSRPSVFLTMVSAGNGKSFIPLSMKGMVPNGVVLRPFCTPHLRIPFSLVWMKTRTSPAIELLATITGMTFDPEMPPL